MLASQNSIAGRKPYRANTMAGRYGAIVLLLLLQGLAAAAANDVEDQLSQAVDSLKAHASRLQDKVKAIQHDTNSKSRQVEVLKSQVASLREKLKDSGKEVESHATKVNARKKQLVALQARTQELQRDIRPSNKQQPEEPDKYGNRALSTAVQWADEIFEDIHIALGTKYSIGDFEGDGNIDSYMDTNGDYYAYRSWKVNSKIQDTDVYPEGIYQTQRYGGWGTPLVFTIHVHEEGDYLVRLHWAEIWLWGGAGWKRRMKVEIQDSIVYDDLDVAAVKGGYLKAYRHEELVPVTDGSVRIKISALQDVPMLSALEVIHQSAHPCDTRRDGKDFFFEGCNVKVRNGQTKTRDMDGTGNLILGHYECGHTAGSLHDEAVGCVRSGSHNVIVGGEHEFSSFGGVVSGYHNKIGDVYASAIGGSYNDANGRESTVLGGKENLASGLAATVVGGLNNHAAGPYSAVAGGKDNVAFGENSFIHGGSSNNATTLGSGIVGGVNQVADDENGYEVVVKVAAA